MKTLVKVETNANGKGVTRGKGENVIMDGAEGLYPYSRYTVKYFSDSYITIFECDNKNLFGFLKILELYFQPIF